MWGGSRIQPTSTNAKKKKKEQYQRRREFRRTVCLAYMHTLPPPQLKEYLETFGTRKLLGSHVSFAHLPVG